MASVEAKINCAASLQMASVEAKINSVASLVMASVEAKINEVAVGSITSGGKCRRTDQ